MDGPVLRDTGASVVTAKLDQPLDIDSVRIDDRACGGRHSDDDRAQFEVAEHRGLADGAESLDGDACATQVESQRGSRPIGGLGNSEACYSKFVVRQTPEYG